MKAVKAIFDGQDIKLVEPVPMARQRGDKGISRAFVLSDQDKSAIILGGLKKI